MINWHEIQAELSPIRDFEDLSRRWREGFAYRFVLDSYNFSMSGMADYTARLLGGDTRKRYEKWAEFLILCFRRLDTLGVKNVLDLVNQVDTQELFEGFCAQTAMVPKNVINVLKYMAYWFIPMKKYLTGLVKKDPQFALAIDQLRQAGIRYNLDLIEQGITPGARRALAAQVGADEAAITRLVNWADFSRLPWASAATISNIVGAGYGSIASLAAANLEQVKADFFRYGASIHKNLKFGNEIENSHRIARIIPKILIESS